MSGVFKDHFASFYTRKPCQRSWSYRSSRAVSPRLAEGSRISKPATQDRLLLMCLAGAGLTESRDDGRRAELVVPYWPASLILGWRW
jgi:hypothetical protein